MKTDYFQYRFRAAGVVDIGKKRQANQDEMFLEPDLGLFGVSDGMGGLESGGIASAFVKKGLPLLVNECRAQWPETPPEPGEAGEQLAECVRTISDHLFEDGNTERFFRYGATVAGVMLHGDKAIFVSLGDSRGYILRKYRRKMEQITEDMNLAGILMKAGEMTKEEAMKSPLSSRLTAFVGMAPPAVPDVFVTEVRPGDRILLCSDGLYGMVPEKEIARLLRSSRDPEKVCRRLIDRANECGGRDNISAVYVRIM